MAWHAPALNPFSTINNMSLSVSRSNSIFTFFRHVCHAKPGDKKSRLDQADKFLFTFLEGSKYIH